MSTITTDSGLQFIELTTLGVDTRLTNVYRVDFLAGKNQVNGR